MNWVGEISEDRSGVRRIVLLGASNITISLPRIVDLLRAGWDDDLDLLIAHGHGRSFGRWSNVLFRSLPGIVDCGLWNDLRDRRSDDSPTSALITDVGNDLLYGQTPEQIAAWVSTCLDQLAADDLEVVMTLLPMESILRLSALRYHLTRLCFFPGQGPSWSVMRQRTECLNDHLIAAARTHHATVIKPSREWYGFDPIHIRRGKRDTAWSSILKGWPSRVVERSPSPLLWRERLRLLASRPAERKLFGRKQQHPQPSHGVGNVTLSIY